MKSIILLIPVYFLSAFRADGQSLKDTVQAKDGNKKVLFYEDCMDSLTKNRLYIFRVDRGSHTAFANRDFHKMALPLIQPVITTAKAISKKHGDLTYDYLYRSTVDTPYSFNNFSQHNLLVNVYSTISGLPVTWQFNTRQSNAFFLRDYTSVGVQFDADTYKEQLREKIRYDYVKKLYSGANEDAVLQMLKTRQSEEQALKAWLNDDRQLQQLINYKQQLNNIPVNQAVQLLSTQIPPGTTSVKAQKAISTTVDITKQGKVNNIKEESLGKAGQLINQDKLKNDAQKRISEKIDSSVDYSNTNDSLPGNKDTVKYTSRQKVIQDSLVKIKSKADAFIKEYQDKQEQYNTLVKEVSLLQKNYKAGITQYRQRLDSLQNDLIPNDALLTKLKEDSAYHDKYKWFKFLLSVRKVAIGRSMVDYSDLSVKNVAVNGINVEYSNRIYLAFAAGFLDYRVRDFIIQQAGAPKQYFAAAKVGLGGPEQNNILLTAYTGRKQASYYTAGNSPAVNNVSGITLSGKYFINRGTYFVAEVAKSSYPGLINVTGNPDATHQSFNFSDHSNEAYSLQLFSFIESTGTRLYGQYKYTGRNFQSFNVYNYNTNTATWQLRADQYFFKRKLYITGAVKKNEYNSPYLANNYKSDYIFKSIQATLRIRKWPSLSVGYMPSSQLTNINNQITEYRFNTLMANSNYTVQAGKKYISTTVVYTRFFNSSDERSFVFYNAGSIYINNSITGNRLTFSSSMGSTANNNYRLLTFEEAVNVNMLKNLSCGAGVKLNSMNSAEQKFGGSGNLRWNAGRIGSFSLYYDRGSIPGINQQLVTSDFGRIVYTKTF